MELVRTIKLKVDLSPDVIMPTIKAYTEAFNSVCAIGWKDNDSNGISLHNKTYATIRRYLPSQLAISARMWAVESLKSIKTKAKLGYKITWTLYAIQVALLLMSVS